MERNEVGDGWVKVEENVESIVSMASGVLEVSRRRRRTVLEGEQTRNRLRKMLRIKFTVREPEREGNIVSSFERKYINIKTMYTKKG